MSKLPDGPWQQLSVDFYTLPNGEEALVVIDDFSRFPEVIPVKSTATATVIKALEDIFSRHGYPLTIRSDNGPSFNGRMLSEYFSHRGIHNRKITPLWPCANGEAERFMRTLNKFMCTTKAANLNWRDAISSFLLNYRATPHTTTGFSPSQLLYNREIKGKLPMLSKNIGVHQGPDAVKETRPNKR